ncbi:tRNA (adenosine(37)-N6)-threonylcarbamoyltransferase complex dimerization subunit type 1 TsaB [Pseudonocardia sp. WMMC193]|uniref:tRNA (adenosine(37)-N6)-threonylcarbamoyltransferase complex dimerization subunit type 1 TsaB n=1 Tax=Pseudonocardia sp. WMMC193 TaxID=2911965 RepID=UPI001F00168F|nr:tRNA (adenosine(37)-N6)-threonylcarbamoyltransferase complex dimerization subunit type 1 TsaB [Pseudonocardia sp. WMMC193]MCF7553164.1 tRNA (adenosine(37)-N6)-threonylcarbamoyltransferase complex dimerization subunit type 1 TsaB [Pseudonocardia sp. WMMC193]
MLVLALDTSTPAVTAGLVRDGVTVAERVETDGRKHGELLMPAVQAVCAGAGVALRELDAVVVGAGPGPFTGLRVGMVTAAALGDALGIPVHGVCSLDAIAAAVVADGPLTGNLLVVTDARRREVYWAAYEAEGARLSGPTVESPDALRERLPGLRLVAAAGTMAAGFGLPVHEATPSPAGLVAVAPLHSAPGPLEPLYLRRPDAVPPGERKQVAR